ncbi:FAD-binding protein [Acerihabitans sp. KWT182]|uniref:FAD-binding protein n=1 Tax=Acerihabitans sp. KWT182 TaxID=3157919 RepID=A0AAU7QB84_9GAMM
MKTIVTDVLVIGGGLAGLRLGVGAKRRGHDVTLLSLVPPKRSHSAAAQGGMQASLANVIKGQGIPKTFILKTPCAAATGGPTRMWCACL